MSTMKGNVSRLRIRLEQMFSRLGLGMRAKLIMLFVIIKVVPLVLLALVAWNQSWKLGADMRTRTEEIALKAVEALSETGDIAVNDAVQALDSRATDDIERMSTDAARRVADFLYRRDNDVLFAAKLTPNEGVYRNFVAAHTGKLIKEGKWELAPDGKSWRPAEVPPLMREIVSSIEENDHSFHYRPPEAFAYEDRPLYLEMTFVDPDGNEKIKVTGSPLMDPELKDVSDRRNTFVRAENYFQELKKLKPGEIYVSDVIGEYVGSRVIGMYTPENAAKAGEAFEPENSAYAGRENPLGKRFKGLVRWATPVEENGKVVGYVTLALDHDHIMEFTAHIIPTRARYTELPDASEGNYAFIWDHKGRNIVHPRHFSIAGYDAATGDPQVPWLEDWIYDDWQASGLSYAEFIEDVPTFVEQSNSKKPAAALTKQGLVGLDCRYLNFAPQCTGWFDLTKEGGSGSFLILWSGLWKLNTAAAIPYYTGQYAASPRGFGFIAVGAGVDDFHRPATETQKVINSLIESTEQELAAFSNETFRAIGDNLFETAMGLSVSTGVMAVLVVLIAIWMASVFTRSITHLIEGISRFRSGERQFRFHAEVKDEMGALADSFDEMADSLVDSVKGPVVIISLDRKVRYINEDGLKLMRKTLDEVVGTPYAESTIFPPGTRYCPLSALAAEREAEVLYHVPSARHYRGKADFLTNRDGEKAGYIITTTDVTAIIEEQKRIEQQRALLETVFTSSPDLIWYKDSKGKYLAVNPRFAAVLGKTQAEIIGRTVEEAAAPDLARMLLDNDTVAVESGVPLYTEEVLAFGDGHTETLDAVRTPLYTAHGELIGLLGVARDVSQRAHIENELRATQLELKKAAAAANRASESKSAFLARMSHEIRTPMNAIIGLTGIAKRKLKNDSAPKEELVSHLRQIEMSSAHLLGLLNDILDISKIEAGHIELSEVPFDLSRLAGNVATIIRPRCLEKNIRFDVELEGVEASEMFVSDELRLRQVLINLLGNAVKFTPECGVVTFRTRRVRRDGNRSLIKFAVSDTGIGISEEALSSLFMPFEQGGAHISRQYGGTGLGLSISKNIVTMLGGEIRVSSVEGEGSEFSFDLWLDHGAAAAECVHEEGDRSMLPGKHVLLVDDVDINRIIVVEQLTPTGLLIDEAEDGVEAVEKFAASPVGYYDIILMDVQMPQMNGYEASDAIRKMDRPDAAAVPIVAMTANAFKEDVDTALAHGMNSHLAKPLETDLLMETLALFLGKRRNGD